MEPPSSLAMITAAYSQMAIANEYVFCSRDKYLMRQPIDSIAYRMHIRDLEVLDAIDVQLGVPRSKGFIAHVPSYSVSRMSSHSGVEARNDTLNERLLR
jgi:hypothetical protein